MTFKKKHSLAALMLFFIFADVAAGKTCDLVGVEKVNRAFPRGAPWMAIGGEGESVAADRCQFATDPRASGNAFVDTKNAFAVTRRSMASAEAEALVAKRMEAHMKDASYEVRPIRVSGGSGFLSLHKSTADQATRDTLVLVVRHRNAILEASLYLDGQIRQEDQEAAEALMRALLQPPN